MVYNIGLDGSGVHCRGDTVNQKPLSSSAARAYRFPETAEVPPHFAAEIKRLNRISSARKVLRYFRSQLESKYSAVKSS
jgi:hypothetical protein